MLMHGAMSLTCHSKQPLWRSGAVSLSNTLKTTAADARAQGSSSLSDVGQGGHVSQDLGFLWKITQMRQTALIKVRSCSAV